MTDSVAWVLAACVAVYVFSAMLNLLVCAFICIFDGCTERRIKESAYITFMPFVNAIYAGIIVGRLVQFGIEGISCKRP